MAKRKQSGEPAKAIFLSYASQDADAAGRICAALRDAGFVVWFDQSVLRGGDAWDASIRKQLKECALFVALISAHTNARSEGYFRLEWKLAVDRSHLFADDQAFLLPVLIDDTPEPAARVPERFRERQWIRLPGGEPTAEFAEHVGRLLSGRAATGKPARAQQSAAATQLAPTASPASNPAAPAKPAVAEQHRIIICVLPFANMSGDAEQEYFSDGISEDIITDLSKVSALAVTSRNSAFKYKSKNVDLQKVVRELKVSHVLEGSVRKSGGRVRITAQLIDGTTNDHVWAERYDRDLSDIFAVQDEISQAIVKALKLKLLPEEKRAIEQRGTSSIDAYNLYLMARQYSFTGNTGSARRSEAIIRLCTRAVGIDPNYAHAWALMASAQVRLRHEHGRGDGGLTAAERALALDQNLAEAHAAKAEYLMNDRRIEEARAEIDIALRLDPESHAVNHAAARVAYTMRRPADSIRYYEKAAAIMEGDFASVGMLVSCYTTIGDSEAARHAAQRTLARAEKIVAVEPDNGTAMSFVVGALAVLGEAERAKAWADRAMLLDPENKNMRYNCACAFASILHEAETALDLLGPVLEQYGIEQLNWTQADPDLDSIRDHPRFQAMLAAAEARLAATAALP